MARKPTKTKPSVPTPEPPAAKPALAVPTPRAPARGSAVPLSDIGSAQAPFLYFEDASAFGYLNGVIRITLEAGRIFAGPGGGVILDRVVTAHLRMNVPAARSLRVALDGALLMATPAKTESKN